MENEENKKYSDERVGHVGPSTEEKSYRGLNPSEIWRTAQRLAWVGGWDPCGAV